MSKVLKDHFGIPYINPNGDVATCEVPIEGFLTKGKTYQILELRPEEGRVTLIDDRGLEMWARADRFVIDVAKLIITGSYDRNTTCVDCGVETQPGVGSARCSQCWEDRCGHEN